MLRKIVLIAAVVGIPIVILIAVQYGQVKSITFQEAIKTAENKSESETKKSISIKGRVLIDKDHPLSREDGLKFFVRDDMMTDFFVSYSGEKEVGKLENMQSVTLTGHAHGGGQPYFHATSVIVGY